MLKGANMNLYLHLKGFLGCFQTLFYHKHSRALFCLQEEGVAQSISILDIARIVSRLRSCVNLQVHFELAFGILFPST